MFFLLKSVDIFYFIAKCNKVAKQATNMHPLRKLLSRSIQKIENMLSEFDRSFIFRSYRLRQIHFITDFFSHSTRLELHRKTDNFEGC